jgi:type I restriction enzyme S subunit
LDDTIAYAGGDIVILRPDAEMNAVFMGYLLNTPAVVRQKASRGQGDAVVHISAAALAQVGVQLPSLKEQAAIAQVLSDIDTDIDALESRLTKARALKQAMAQALLTGRIRLVEPQPACAASQGADANQASCEGAIT